MFDFIKKESETIYNYLAWKSSIMTREDYNMMGYNKLVSYIIARSRAVDNNYKLVPNLAKDNREENVFSTMEKLHLEVFYDKINRRKKKYNRKQLLKNKNIN